MKKYKTLQVRSRVLDSGTAVRTRLMQEVDGSELIVVIQVCRDFVLQEMALLPDTLGVVKELTELLDGQTHWMLATGWTGDTAIAQEVGRD